MSPPSAARQASRPLCRDCADFGPICPNSGRPCGGTDAAPRTEQRAGQAPAEGDARDAQEQPFEDWWEREGQFCRAGGGQYEKTFAWNAWCAASKAQPKHTAEEWLRGRYGAYRGHFAWRELEEAFNAGAATQSPAPGDCTQHANRREIIDALHAALNRHEAATDAMAATLAGDDPHAAALAGIELEKATALLSTWTQAEYLRVLIDCAAVQAPAVGDGALVEANDFAKQLADLCQRHEKKLLAYMAREVALKNYETAMRTPLFQQARAVMGTENEWQDNALRAAILHYMTSPGEATAQSHPPVQGRQS